MTGRVGNSEFCVPSTSVLPQGTLGVLARQSSLFPLDPVNNLVFLSKTLDLHSTDLSPVYKWVKGNLMLVVTL